MKGVREKEKELPSKRKNKRQAFTRWRELKEAEGCKSDAELAFFLLDLSVITY